MISQIFSDLMYLDLLIRTNWYKRSRGPNIRATVRPLQQKMDYDDITNVGHLYDLSLNLKAQHKMRSTYEDIKTQ